MKKNWRPFTRSCAVSFSLIVTPANTNPRPRNPEVVRRRARSPFPTLFTGSPPATALTRASPPTHMRTVIERTAKILATRFENLFAGERYRDSSVPRTCSSRMENPISHRVNERMMFTTNPYAIAPANVLIRAASPPANATVVRTKRRMIRKICAKSAANAIGYRLYSRRVFRAIIPNVSNRCARSRRARPKPRCTTPAVRTGRPPGPSSRALRPAEERVPEERHEPRGEEHEPEDDVPRSVDRGDSQEGGLDCV